MPDIHLVIGAENSPYSIKVRSFLRYKGIPHAWLRRAQATAEFQRHARVPLIPMVVTPDDVGMQDSTPIIETLEARFPLPSIVPDDPVCAFASALVEEFADEWGNKWMFHFRWAREADQVAASRRLVRDSNPVIGDAEVERAALSVRERMVPRVWFVGSNDTTATQIEQSFADSLPLIDAHLAARPFLFGGRPSLADFGLWGQIGNAVKDPTPASIARHFAHLNAWIARMADPAAVGPFEPFASVAPTLMPLLREQVGALFLPWSLANAAAIDAGQESFEVVLAGRRWKQKPQKYHARSLAALRVRYRRERTEAIDAVLRDAGCLASLA